MTDRRRTVAADIGRNPARTVEPLTGGERLPRLAGILAAFDGGAAFDVRHGRTVAASAEMKKCFSHFAVWWRIGYQCEGTAAE